MTGHAAAAPTSVRNWRRLIAGPQPLYRVASCLAPETWTADRSNFCVRSGRGAVEMVLLRRNVR